MNPAITEAHWVLWYGLIYFSAIVGAWMLVTALLLLWRTLRPPAASAAKPPQGKRYEAPDLDNDPALHRFFASVNHAYRRRPPPHAQAPAPGTTPLQPRVIRERAGPELIAEAPPLPKPVSTLPDPNVLHSAPFYSPREGSGARSQPTARPSALSPAKSGPSPAEKDLIVLVNIWAQLSEKDRRELLALARIKAGLDR